MGSAQPSVRVSNLGLREPVPGTGVNRTTVYLLASGASTTYYGVCVGAAFVGAVAAFIAQFFR